MTDVEPEGFVWTDPVAVCIEVAAVPDPETVKYRVHLDLATISAAHQTELVARLKDLGATPADVGQATSPERPGSSSASAPSGVPASLLVMDGVDAGVWRGLGDLLDAVLRESEGGANAPAGRHPGRRLGVGVVDRRQRLPAVASH